MPIRASMLLSITSIAINQLILWPRECKAESFQPPHSAAEAWARGSTKGATQELAGLLRRRSPPTGTDGEAYFENTYRALNKRERIVFALMALAGTMGGESRMRMRAMLEHDRGLFVAALRTAQPSLLTRFCRFTGGDPETFVFNADDLLGVKLDLPPKETQPYSSLSHTYIEAPPFERNISAAAVYGHAVAHVYSTLLKEALGFPLPKDRISVSFYYQTEYPFLLDDKQQVMLVLLIAGETAYRYREDIGLCKILSRQAKLIYNITARLDRARVQEYCRWSQIDVGQFQDNLRHMAH